MAQSATSLGPRPSLFFVFFWGGEVVWFFFFCLFLQKNLFFPLRKGIFVYCSVSPFVFLSFSSLFSFFLWFSDVFLSPSFFCPFYVFCCLFFVVFCFYLLLFHENINIKILYFKVCLSSIIYVFWVFYLFPILFP